MALWLARGVTPVGHLRGARAAGLTRPVYLMRLASLEHAGYLRVLSRNRDGSPRDWVGSQDPEQLDAYARDYAVRGVAALVATPESE